MLEKITSKLDIHSLEVLVKSFKTSLVKILGMIGSLLVSIFLGRTLGSEGLGVVNFANKFGMILLILTMFGFQNVLIKFIAIAKAELDDNGIVSSLKTSLVFNGLLSIVIASAGAFTLPFVLETWFGNHDMYIPLLIVFVMLIPQTIARVYSSALNGYGKIWQANLVDQTLSPILVGLGILLFLNFEISFSTISVLVLYAISRLLLAFIVFVLWNKTFKTEIKGQFNFKRMFNIAKPMLLITGTGVIASNADTIMLGVLGTFKDVGIYSVAARLALLTSFFLYVTNAAIAPKLASLFHESKIIEMQLMVKSVTKGLAFGAFLFVIFFLVLGQWLLGFWGTEFRDAYWILLILVIGQFFNIATGCSGILLVMCGYEKIHGCISLISVFLNIILNVILITKYAALGAAMATAITVILENTTKVVLARRKINILTLPF